MVNQELVNWIKSEEAQGYSEIALTKVLTKQNYSTKDIQEAFNSLKEKKNGKIPLSISFTLLTGFGFISLVLVTIILSIASFFAASKVVGYLLITLSGAGIGYYIYHVKQKLNATERLGAVLGILSPIPALILIITSLKTLQMLSEQLAQFSADQQSSITGSGMDSILSIFGVSIDPFFSAILFYLFCNVFIIISIIKKKEYLTFLWYLLAPTLFFVLWLIIDLFTSPIFSRALI